MPDQEMLREIKRVVELTLRIDERVKNIAEGHDRVAERFDQFLEQHATLTERVIKLEATTSNDRRIEDVEEEQKRLITRVMTVEANAPYALKVVDQSLEALNKLSDRVTKVEATTGTVSTWQSWFNWAGDWCFKLAWIIIAAYILTKLGLGGVNLPSPF